MPASEETYRSQRRLHIVFGLSSAAMALTIVWMIAADHIRPWKETQREFQEIELAKLDAQKAEAEEQLRAESQAELDAAEQRIADARAIIAENRDEIAAQEAEIAQLQGTVTRLDTRRKFVKQELDSQRSLYDGMIERGEGRRALEYRRETVAPTQRRLDQITEEFQQAEARVVEARRYLDEELRADIEELERERDRIRREVERAERTIEQREAEYTGVTAWVRDLPLMDMAAPSTKIQQISLPDLTINYNFKEVPRYDRCTTCHLGIDRIGYETKADGTEMPQPFASHPMLSGGATAIDPRGNLVEAGLYLDSNGPHPINSFGCTICHGGQGSGTDFSYASHSPDSLEEHHHWEEEHGFFEVHHWDFPMLPSRFVESSCIKCHHDVTDVPEATKLQAGYDRIVKYGCTGCHQIGGEGSFGPDLTDAPQVGPNLAHVAYKVSDEWLRQWIKNPHAFRPDSRMPRFYDVANNDTERDEPFVDAEVHAMAHYLTHDSVSTPPSGFVEPSDSDRPGPLDLPARSRTDASRGEGLFLSKGCMACHAHEEYGPDSFPEDVARYAEADHGPDLSAIAAKFPSDDEGYAWLANWLHAPEAYHPESLMPNLQLSWQESADIASWLLSIPGEWVEPVLVAAIESSETAAALDELVGLYAMRSGAPLAGIDAQVEEMSLDEKLMMVGERTIGRLGCFGCHNIPGFEDYKPIGTALNGWGHKLTARLDYAHIGDYLEDHAELRDDGTYTYDGTPPYYREQLVEETRSGFLFQKLHRPRSYDYKKTNPDLKAWDERLRMPRFSWADDPEAIEEIMTFVLGLTGEQINSEYLPREHSTPRQVALAHGRRLIRRYNCDGCHVLEMPKFVIPEGTAVAEAAVRFERDVATSAGPQGRGLDYVDTFFPELAAEAGGGAEPSLGPDDGARYVIEGMPRSYYRDDEAGANELIVQFWRPTTIRGYTFNVGDQITLNPDAIERIEPVGGDFAWLYASTERNSMVDEEYGLAEIAYAIDTWNYLPPPLLREGEKVQTPWLTRFLRDPYAIRPITNLRMPRFHYLEPGDDTRELADYFAAVDRAEFPYQELPQLSQGYLAEHYREHPNYIADGWHMMAAQGSACLGCHSIGTHQVATGPDVVAGPHLNQVAERFRPEYLAEWLASPARLLPYTKMPQNIPTQGQPGIAMPESWGVEPREDLIFAIRDTLLNYRRAVEEQLASSAAPPSSAPADADEAAGGGE